MIESRVVLKENKKSTGKFLFLVVLFWFGQYVFIPFFSPHLAALGIASSAIGIIVGTYGFSQLLLRIPFGFLADKLKSHRIFMLLGFFSLALAGGSLYLADSPPLFLFARFFAGVSASTWVSFTVFFSGLATKGNESKAISTVMTANNMGTLLAYVFGMVFYDRLGIRMLFLISILAGVVGLIVTLTMREESTFSAEPMRLRDVTVVLRDRKLLLHSMLAALVQFITFATALSFTANYAKQLHATGVQLGLLSIIFSASGMIGSFWVGTKMSKNIPDKVKLLASFALLALYCLLIPRCTTVTELLFVQAIGGIPRAIAMTMTMALSFQTIPTKLRSTAMGVYQSIYGLGMTVGPVVMGGLLELTRSNFTAFAVIGAVSVLGMLWSFFMVKPQERVTK